jgi:hypothetical protein
LQDIEHTQREHVPPLEDAPLRYAIPTGIDPAQWRARQEAERRKDLQRKAAKAKQRPDWSEFDARVRSQIMTAIDIDGDLHEVIAGAISDVRFALRSEIQELRSEVASLRADLAPQSKGSVTVLPSKGKNAA